MQIKFSANEARFSIFSCFESNEKIPEENPLRMRNYAKRDKLHFMEISGKLLWKIYS